MRITKMWQTQRHEVSKGCWENSASVGHLLDTGLPQILNVQITQYLQSAIKRSAPVLQTPYPTAAEDADTGFLCHLNVTMVRCDSFPLISPLFPILTSHHRQPAADLKLQSNCHLFHISYKSSPTRLPTFLAPLLWRSSKLSPHHIWALAHRPPDALPGVSQQSSKGPGHL